MELAGAHAPAQALNPALQVKSHWPITHVAAPFAGVGQGVHRLPQLVGAVSDTQASPQRWKPTLQTKSHACAGVQVAVPLAGAGQGVQRLPQDAGWVSSAQASPHRWKPLLHSKSHCLLVQAGREFAGTEHGPQRVPQELTASSSTQVVPQRWVPARQLTPHTPPVQVGVPLVAGQGEQRLPQVATSSFDAQASRQRWKPLGQTPASGRTRSHRLSAQVSSPSHARQKSAPVPQAALSLPGRHSPAEEQQPSGQVERLQGGFSCGHPVSARTSRRARGDERTDIGFP